MSHCVHFNNLFDLISSFVSTGIIDIIEGYFGKLYCATIRGEKGGKKGCGRISWIYHKVDQANLLLLV